jgi:hypothetical protein
LAENAGKQFTTDIAFVGIGNRDGEVALDHEGMLPSCVRTVKSKRSQASH